MRRVHPKKAAHVCFSMGWHSDPPTKLPQTYSLSQTNFKCLRVASTFRVVGDPEHNFPASVVRRGLLLRLYGIS